MIYTQYSQEWLNDNANARALFVVAEVYNVLTTSTNTVYLSTTGYITEEAVPTVFKPLITRGLQFTESLSLDSDSAALSYGDIEISNPNGDLDDWLDGTKYIWKNRQIQVYLGDPSWASTSIANLISKCLKVFDGVTFDMDSKSRESLNILLRDKLEYVNTPVTEETFDGTEGTWIEGASASPVFSVTKPIVFGEVFNITPVLIDPPNMKYMVSNGEVEKVIEIRDNGVPIYTNPGLLTGATVSPDGTFSLTYPAYGAITASVQGLKKSVTYSGGTTTISTATYANNISKIITVILTQYGKTDTKLVSSDIDITNFDSFASANTQAVGCLVEDKVNTIDICSQIAGSVGAQLRMTRLGKLQLIRLVASPSGPTATIDDADIIHHSLSISLRPEVIAAVKLGYCKNYTVQTPLDTGITTSAKSNFAEEWYVVDKVDTTAQTKYKLSTEPDQEDTLLVVKTEAEAEAQRRLDMFKTQKTVYKFMGTSKLLSLSLGQVVTLKHNRFGLSAGKVGQVISLKPDWLAASIEVEVLI